MNVKFLRKLERLEQDTLTKNPKLHIIRINQGDKTEVPRDTEHDTYLVIERLDSHFKSL